MKNVLAVMNGTFESSYAPFSIPAPAPRGLLSIGTFSNAVPESERDEVRLSMAKKCPALWRVGSKNSAELGEERRDIYHMLALHPSMSSSILPPRSAAQQSPCHRYPPVIPSALHSPSPSSPSKVFAVVIPHLQKPSQVHTQEQNASQPSSPLYPTKSLHRTSIVLSLHHNHHNRPKQIRPRSCEPFPFPSYVIPDPGPRRESLGCILRCF